MGSFRVTAVNDGPAPFHVDAVDDSATAGDATELRLVFPAGDYPPIEIGSSISVSYIRAAPPAPPKEPTDG